MKQSFSTKTTKRKPAVTPDLPKSVLTWQILLAGALLFTSALAVVYQIDRQQTYLHQLKVKKDAAKTASPISDMIAYEINKRLVLVRALEAFNASREGFTEDDFVGFTSELEAEDDKIISLQLAPNGVVAHVSKPERNADVIGHNLLADPARAALALRSMETGQYVIVGPVTLKQGGTGLIARKPLFIRDSVAEKSFWGFATVVMDFSVVTDVFSALPEDNRFQYALMSQRNRTMDNQIIWGDRDLFEQSPQLSMISLPAGNWILAAVPIGGWPTAWPYAVSFRVAALIIAGALSAMVVALLARPARLQKAIDSATLELKTSEGKLRAAHRIAQIGFWEITSRAHINASPEMLSVLGIEPSQFDGAIDSVCARVKPLDRSRICAQLRLVAEQKMSFETTFEVTRSDGSTAVIKITGEAPKSDTGSDAMSCGTVQDITEQTLNERRLRSAQKMEAVGRLTGGVAHDFNNLLAVIQGNADLLEMTSDHDPDLIQEIRRASERGAALTHRLLAYARKQPLSPRSTHLGNLVNGMFGLLSRSLGETIKVDVHADENLWNVKVDAGQLEDAILNLALNSRDAMPGGGKINIRITNVTVYPNAKSERQKQISGEFVCLTVSDTGAGMDPETQTRAFEPFFTTKEIGKGSGLGLSMVSGFVAQSEGRVDLYSELGFGTVINIYLPRNVTQEFPVETDQTVSQIPKGNKDVVLIIEDNPSVRAMVSRTVRDLGYVTLEAEDVKAARLVLNSGKQVDIVLSDIVLPGGTSGLDFVPEIQRNYANTGVVLMSGYPAEDQANGHSSTTKHAFLRKPFRKIDLAIALDNELKKQAPVRISAAQKTAALAY